ncbi:LPXTG cell wall anchor domain-containing protein [Corynebacterium pseudodiphtheriticum]|uniref:LPXTG cell wall anchor domain-containing protein n=1 Tax=Corynebacterium pseudodiphtheriticum TaxID=37637 RepID=UPI002543F011|nr:LPXTG cell wall anchor domain-containing protein [Corynebacterium pseudodiphtheriticum]MDK4296851.1 LPXTG cell wall anchor domain-containing protein [Corynebacterium pseudodiphtheriticum]MDK8564129.1 LPXTG cell wall anchor domain-containing protein [Corynebacterium pseudodiphtheriticum]
MKNARFIKNGSTCRGSNVTTQSFGNKVVEFDVSRCNVNIWEGSNDELRVEDIALSGGGQVPPDAFAMNVWVDDIFDPGDAREWTTQAENGVLTTLIEPEDRLETSRVQMRRTIERAAKIKGPFVARLQNQNGFDVDGGQELAELRIIGPRGETRYSKRINANDGHAEALEPGNGWGGIDFKEDREFTVPAGSRVEVDMVLHGRNKHGRNLKEPNTRSPLGPGALEFATTLLEQRRQICVEAQESAPITGFQLQQRGGLSGGIRRIESASFGSDEAAQQITVPLKITIDGLNARGKFQPLVEQPTHQTQDSQEKRHFCVELSFNADRDVSQEQMDQHFELTLSYALIPLQVQAFDYDERGDVNKTVLVGAEFAVYASKPADGAAGLEPADQPDWDKPVWRSRDGDSAKLAPGVYYLVEVQVQGANSRPYSLLPAPVRFRLSYGEENSDGFDIHVPPTAEAPFVLAAKVENGRAIMEIGNITRGEMPQTGGHGIWVFVIVGVVLVIGGGLAMQRRREA